MIKYYTRACNFYYGKNSKKLVKQKKTIPLNGNSEISFDHIEILSRNSKKKIHIGKIDKQKFFLKKKIKKDIEIIKKNNKDFCRFNFKKNPNIMGILNLTPDSFSDGGMFNKKNLGYKRANELSKAGATIIDIGGESTRPGSKMVKVNDEWKRIALTLKKLNKKINISLDTRKSEIMERGIKKGVNLINDISGFNYDSKSIKVLKKYKIPFVVHHSQGTPEKMQKNPKYKNVLLDIYDFFEEKILF